MTALGALAASQVGFELGALDTVSFRRVFTGFVICTVVLVASFAATDSDVASSTWSRLVLAWLYVVADVFFLTESVIVTKLLGANQAEAERTVEPGGHLDRNARDRFRWRLHRARSCADVLSS